MLVKKVKRNDIQKGAKYRAQTGLKFQKSRDNFKVFAVVQFQSFILRRGSSIPIKAYLRNQKFTAVMRQLQLLK